MHAGKKLFSLFISSCLFISTQASSLQQAALNNNQHLLYGLIKEKKDINDTNYIFGLTALHCAASKNSLDCLTILITNGATIDKTDEKKRTPLFIAAQEGHAESCTILLEKKANYNVQDKYGNTPLHAAVSGSNIQAALVLLMHGADILSENKHKISPLLLATEQANTDIILLFFWWHLIGKKTPISWKEFKESYVDRGSSDDAPSPYMTITNNQMSKPYMLLIFLFSNEKVAQELLKKNHSDFIELKSKYLIKKK